MIDARSGHATFAVSTRMLRQFAGLCLVIFGGMALWQWLGRGHVVPAAIFGALALGLGPLGLLKPEAIRPVFLAWTAVASKIGYVVSLLILGVLLYGFFTPLAVFFRLTGRDVLLRKRGNRESYWVPVRGKDVRRYLRQY
jgi:hypothetical protein